MRPSHLSRLLIIFSATLLLCCTIASAGEAKKEQTVFSVKQYMTTSPSGTATVQGVVSQVYSDEHFIALVDSSNCKTNCKTSCKKPTLPIRWTGAFPKVKDVVRFTGATQEKKGERFFVATSMTTVNKPQTAVK